LLAEPGRQAGRSLGRVSGSGSGGWSEKLRSWEAVEPIGRILRTGLAEANFAGNPSDSEPSIRRSGYPIVCFSSVIIKIPIPFVPLALMG
jgi:hypothetical protein